MKFLVIGAEGQVGGFLLRELASSHQVWGTSLNFVRNLPALDIRDQAAVIRHLELIRPDQVILAAALTHVDLCEEKPALAEEINVRGTENVARACQRIQAGLTFFSSDYIFDGQSGPYAEDDPPNPLSVYGRTKLAGEKIVSGLVDRWLIIRTMVVYSYLPGSLNLFMQLLERARAGEPVSQPGDQLVNPTQAVNLVRALIELVEGGHTGVFNLAGRTRLGRDAFARRVLDELGYDAREVKSILTADLKQKAPRPLASGLNTDKAQAALKTNRLWELDVALDYTLSQMPAEELKP